MTEIPELKNLFNNSSRILLVFNKHKDSFDFLAASSSLFYTLKKFGKIVNCYPPELIANFSKLTSPTKDLKNFILTINNESGIISDIYYQKSPKELKLFLTLTNGEIKTEDIHFSSLDQEEENDPDLIITFGINSLDSLNDFLEKNFKFFSQKPIINIDNHHSNQEFGKINIIDEKSSFSELAIRLIKSINGDIIDQNIATNLMWGIIAHHKMTKIDDSTLKTLIFLKNRGADRRIPALLHNSFTEKERSLIEIILSNTVFNKKLNIPIISIPKSRLSSDKDLLGIIDFLRNGEFLIPSFILLWETESFVGGIMYSADERKLKCLADTLKGTIKDLKVIFKVPDSNLQSTQDNILRILR
jgi:hypothetical protein